MTQITHVAMFANPSDRIAVQETGTSAEAAIAAAVKATGAKVDDFVAIPVTPRMSALLATGEVPSSWVDKDGTMDCEIVYAVFADTTSEWSDEADDTVTAYRNCHGERIEARDAHAAASEAVNECGVERWGSYVVVSYPSALAFDELFNDAGPILHTIRVGVNSDLIVEETVEFDEEEAA